MKIESQMKFVESLKSLTLPQLYLLKNRIESKSEYNKKAKLKLINIE